MENMNNPEKNKNFGNENENLSSSWKNVNNYHLDIFPKHDILIRDYIFDSDESTNNFVSNILNLAKEENHHPLLIAEYHKVILSWSSHEKRAITDLDYKLAKKSDDFYEMIKKRKIE